MDLSNDKTYDLLLAITKKTENLDLKVELQKTATGIQQASVGGGLGVMVGAAAGGIMGGRDGAIVGATLGAAVGSMAATIGEDFKPLPELLESLSEEDRKKVAKAAMKWAKDRGIELTLALSTEASQELLREAVKALGYSLSVPIAK